MLNWFSTYLTGRQYFVNIGEHISDKHDILCGVPQGSVLVPRLFSFYMLPLDQIIRKQGFNFHSYADDTQLYISVAPDNVSSVDKLTICLSSIVSWMNSNFLKLDEEKTEIIIIGNEAKRKKVN